MFDKQVLKALSPILDACADPCAKLKIPANTITFISVGFAVLAFICLAIGQYPLALFFILINRFLDGLDGAVARKIDAMPDADMRGSTDLGGYMDIVLDFIFYAGVVFFYTISQPQYALFGAFLIFSFIGTSSSFLAYAIIAEKQGLSHEFAAPNKAFYYLGGLTEGFETIVFFALICLIPVGFPMFASIFALLCWMTTGMRIYTAWQNFQGEQEREH